MGHIPHMGLKEVRNGTEVHGLTIVQRNTPPNATSSPKTIAVSSLLSAMLEIAAVRVSGTRGNHESCGAWRT